MEDDKNQMMMTCDMGMKMKVVESNRKAQKSKYISISYEIILRTPCMVYTMKQLPQIIGTSSSTCMLCLKKSISDSWKFPEKVFWPEGEMEQGWSQSN